MGRKRTRQGKHLFIHLAYLILITLFFHSCSTLKGDKYYPNIQKHLAKGDYEGAIDKNLRLLSRYPDRTPGDEALFNLGLIYAHYGNPNKDYKKAFSYFWRLLKEFPRSPFAEEAKIWVGVLNKIDETKIKLEGLRSARNTLLRSHTLIAEGDYKDAIEKNQKVLTFYPDSPPGDEALYNMGLIYAHLKDYKKAVKSFERITKDFPQSHFSLEAEIWMGVLNTIEEAKNKMQELRSPRKNSFYIQKFLAKGDYEGALDKNMKLLSRYPDRTPGDEALFNIGLIYAHLKEYKKSLNSFGELIKKFPRSYLAEEAKIWVDVLKTIEEAKRVDIEIEEKKKEFYRY